ncbi:hypothetical protein D187_005005 [Cystobacter fuscus DSM 2262]|uniref:Uncharacterized protein n=1 Tax=Cystobacter fuscus (strain ATCC 25194 / DSM 2262 / NBRC 100088 / M29) TaxID=1242864 RepID=S9PHR0_CYSF2|nr:hypothetical protein D187_005005 [Cystobacter fuscus DSM 2262]
MLHGRRFLGAPRAGGHPVRGRRHGGVRTLRWLGSARRGTRRREALKPSSRPPAPEVLSNFHARPDAS